MDIQTNITHKYSLEMFIIFSTAHHSQRHSQYFIRCILIYFLLSSFLALRTYACNSFACLLWKPTMYVMLFCGELHICCEFVYRQANLCSGLREILVLNL